MAIVEDEVRNESEEENEIEVVVEEDDGDRESDDSEDDDDEVLEHKVAELEQRISACLYNYDEHIELIQALWRLSELDRWRGAFERLAQVFLLQPEHWLLWLSTEVTLAHTLPERHRVNQLFYRSTLDCYYIPILTEWCTWALNFSEPEEARKQIDEVIKRAGADPLSGKVFWDAKLELEKSQLETMSQDNPDYKSQQERILFCLEETVSRPLLHGEDAWQALEELATSLHGQTYVDKVKTQHEAAVEYLQKISPYEDKLLTAENVDEKCKLYQDYIDTVKELSKDKKYAECDSDGILKVLYDRATTECMSAYGGHTLLLEFARHVRRVSTRATYGNMLQGFVRRCPRRHTFWTLQLEQGEYEGKHFTSMKSIFETALSKDMETYKDAECLWLSYLEYLRRQTSFDSDEDVDRLRQNFRLAWDSLAEAWGEEADDCEVPLYWARLEYKRMNDPRQGKEIFEEMFKYGSNKNMTKYWEALIDLETSRQPPISENKRRDLYRRAVRFVTDYPPAIARIWTDYERDFGTLESIVDCYETCETKVDEWKESYEAMKGKMMGKKQKGKQTNKKPKMDKKRKKKEDEDPKNKRKSDETGEGTGAKRKRDKHNMDVEESGKVSEASTSFAQKRAHNEDSDDDASGSKRQRTEEEDSSSRSGGSRDACTLFVSNLEFKVNEQKLRDILSKYGDIVSLRVKAGVKAFGGSICYCQYKTPASVDEAVKHDRTALDGRPMFFSRYSAKKGKAGFKYSTDAEKNKLFVKNLPYSHCTKEALTDVFGKYGKLKDVRVVTFKDGKPKGLAYIEYEDESAASEAINKSNGMMLADRRMEVAMSAPPPKDATGASLAGTSTLGQPKRDTGSGMRRTQLSNFIPSVLQRPSTSKATNGDGKKPLSNSDFRQMLLKK